MKKKYKKIEKLLYFREWAIYLAIKTKDTVYFIMMLDTYRQLRNLGVVVTDVGHKPENAFLHHMERILIYPEEQVKKENPKNDKQSPLQKLRVS